MAEMQQTDSSKNSLLSIIFISYSLSVLDQCASWSARVWLIILLYTITTIRLWTRALREWKAKLFLSIFTAVYTASLIVLAPERVLVLLEWIFHRFLEPFWITHSLSWLTDGPDAQMTLTRERQRSEFYMALCASIMVSQPMWCLTVCVRLTVWIVGPMVCLALLLLPIEKWKVGSKFLIDPIYPRLLQFVYKVWDVCQTLSSGLLNGLPHILQAKYSRYQQKRAAQQQLPTFTYEPLAANEIRLLVLKRITLEIPGIIQATTLRASKDCVPHFEAVSYCWGSPARTEEILINGARFAVTRSALDVLVARRSTWNDRIIWIDAICINQDDAAEKSIQIGHMRDIYRQASRVLAFPSIDYRFRLLELVLTQLSSPNAVRAFYRPMSWYLPPGPERSPLQLRILASFLSLNYFRRSWIFQEVAVGRKIDIYLGGRYLSWDTLWTAIMTFTPAEVEKLAYDYATLGLSTEGHAILSERIRQGLKNIAVMSTYRQASQLQQEAPSPCGVFAALNIASEWNLAGPTIDDLELGVFYTQRFMASDGRDRVFSLLGVVRHDCKQALLLPDYEKSEEQVFKDTALYLFFHTSTPSINLLALAGIGYSDHRKYSHSWVPDLAHDRACNTLTYSKWTGLEFHAADHRSAIMTKGKLPGSLSVTGLLVDEIAFLSPTCMPKLSSSKATEIGQSSRMAQDDHVFSFVEAAISLIDRHSTQWPNLRRQLWQTLIAGGNEDTNAHQTLLPEAFELFLSSKKFGAIEDLRDIVPVWRDLQNFHGRENVSNWLRCLPVYCKILQQVCEGRSFSITRSGRMCLGPALVAVGDTVFVPYGAQLPFTLRSVGHYRRDKVYNLVGEAYVAGISQAELAICDYEPFNALIV